MRSTTALTHQQAELRFDGEGALPALAIIVRWPGTVPADSVVPVLHHPLFKMTTQCIGESAWQFRNSASWTITFPGPELIGDPSLDETVLSCIKTRAKGLEQALLALRIMKLTVDARPRPTESVK